MEKDDLDMPVTKNSQAKQWNRSKISSYKMTAIWEEKVETFIELITEKEWTTFSK